MSHFTRIHTVVRDQTVLCDALRSLHYTFQEGQRVPIRGYQGNRETGQVVVDPGGAYDIGFQRQADESFTICADWWGVKQATPIREDEFLRQINRTYTHLMVRQQVMREGLIIEEERILPNGEIELVVAEPA
jgi:hypothetical protein